MSPSRNKAKSAGRGGWSRAFPIVDWGKGEGKEEAAVAAEVKCSLEQDSDAAREKVGADDCPVSLASYSCV